MGVGCQLNAGKGLPVQRVHARRMAVAPQLVFALYPARLGMLNELKVDEAFFLEALFSSFFYAKGLLMTA